MVIRTAKKELCSILISDEAEFEAREILREVTGTISPDFEISESQYKSALEMVERRNSGEPLQYIFGHWDFCGFDFLVGKGVLIPRTETEELVGLAVNALKKSGGTFLDLCSGSGCIPVSVSLLSGCNGYGVELYDEAYDYFIKNISRNHAQTLVTPIKRDVLFESTVAEFADESLSVIVSNPPYINRRDMNNLQKEVTFEPETALFGGEDGLDFYRQIIPLYLPKLIKNGIFAVEIGEEQGEKVSELFKLAGIIPKVKKDIFGQDRIVYGEKQ